MYDVSYVKCPKCGHDRNPSTATKCEICGQQLKGGGVPPIAWIGLAVALLLLGGGYYWWKSRQVPQTAATSNPVPASGAGATNARDPVASPDVKVYRRMAEVEKVPAGLFNYGGSTTFAPLRSQTVTDAIAKAQPAFKLRYTEPVAGKPGSGTGIAMLLNGELSIAQSSRPLKDNEFSAAQSRGFRLEPVPVALDGIAFFVNPKLGVKELSVEQVAGIFTGKITNWKQVNGPNLPVVPFSRDIKAGGTVDFFNEEVLAKAGLGATVQITRDTTDALRRVATTRGGIGYATAAEVIGQRTVRSVGLAKSGSSNYIQPFGADGRVNSEALRGGNYPVTRRLFVIIRRDGKLDEQAGAAYANLLLSDEGQALVEKSGFVRIR